METLTDLPNIGKVLSEKLEKVGIKNFAQLKALGSEKTLIKLDSLEHSGVCINMLYALEGAIQGVRWHDLPQEKKQELTLFFRMMNKNRSKF